MELLLHKYILLLLLLQFNELQLVYYLNKTPCLELVNHIISILMIINILSVEKH